MPSQSVGAGILSIITESLYDRPIVVFREYVQNAVDSFIKSGVKQDASQLYSVIWTEDEDLYFLDNGNGVEEEEFDSEMRKIASSQKRRVRNVGYKGIGRLSGLPYCKQLTFVNICNYKNRKIQKYLIDGEKYSEIKRTGSYESMSFDELMDEIGTYSAVLNEDEIRKIDVLLQTHGSILSNTNTGFLVILQNISEVLKDVIEDVRFRDELEWLLPVKFKDELLSDGEENIFRYMTEADEDGTVPAISYNVYFNGNKLERPIDKNMLRTYVCSTDFGCAVGVHSFMHNKIAVMKGNSFSGIRIYIDNMLLCNENELLPALREYGLVEHTVNELIQSVKGIGAMIYITDKVNIRANARRTFIEVTDQDAIDFLRKLAEFVESVYDARYALSRYISATKNVEIEQEKFMLLKSEANKALETLAREEINTDDGVGEYRTFSALTETEKKQIIKKKITNKVNAKIKHYLQQTISFDYDNAYEDFLRWLFVTQNTCDKH